MTSENSKEESGKSNALITFETNLDHLKWLLGLHRKDLETPRAIISDIQNRIVIKKGEIANADPETRKLIVDELELAINSIEVLSPGWKFLYHWILVMLLTFVEAYLEDFLVTIVQLNPVWCSSEAMYSFEDLIDNPTIESLRDKVARQWAKNILRQGTPKNWIKRLEGFGVGGYPDNFGKNLEKIWDRRNEIVHEPNNQLSDGLKYLKGAIGECGLFVKITDAFLGEFMATKR
jgi:hypothetical protein